MTAQDAADFEPLVFDVPPGVNSRVHVIVVAVPEARMVRGEKEMSLASADASMSSLVDFWASLAASNDVATFGGAVASIHRFRLVPTSDGLNRAPNLLSRLGRAVKNARGDDRLVVHWIGHGAVVTEQLDHILYLPDRLADQKAEQSDPETIFLRRVVKRLLAECGARDQFYFFDVCGVRDPDLDYLEDHALDREDRKQPRDVGTRQLTWVASGEGGRAMSPAPGQASFFTSAFIDVLRRYPSDMQRRLRTGFLFDKALAARVRSLWLESATKYHPDPGPEFRNWEDGWQDLYVRRLPVAPYKPVPDGVMLGATAECMMQAFFASSEGLKDQQSVFECGTWSGPAARHLYEFGHGMVAAWSADVPPPAQFAEKVFLKLTDSSSDSQQPELVCHADFDWPVTQVLNAFARRE